MAEAMTAEKETEQLYSDAIRAMENHDPKFCKRYYRRCAQA